MKTIQEEALIKGSFTKEQAQFIITTLFRSKIQMHSSESFSSLIRTGRESAEDNSRIRELNESLQRLMQVLNEIKDHNTMVKIDGLVSMEIINQDLL